MGFTKAPRCVKSARPYPRHLPYEFNRHPRAHRHAALRRSCGTSICRCSGRCRGISAIVIPGVEPESWADLLETAADLREIAPTVRFHTALGIHPQVLPELDPAHDSAVLTALTDQIRAAPAGLVAIGECGLDFGVGVPRERQVAVLRAHFALARATGLPLLLHCLKAHAAMLELLDEQPLPPSILHSYSGSAEMVPAYCRGGHAISFAGAITLPGARRPVLAARAVAADRLLIETDSPDQTPASRRPARNEPAFLEDIARAVAAARAEPLELVAATTTANARRLLRLAA
nr:TatD family hydrolase [Nannocystis pusilla]